MKKFLLVLFFSFFFIISVNAEEEVLEENTKKQVELIECVSSTTSWVKVDEEVIRIRLLAYDSLDGNLNNEIEEYVCSTLESAKVIEIEYDIASKDKYNREMVWVYTDGLLLQNELVKLGYGQVNFVTSDYKYLDILCESQKSAIINSLGVWNYDEVTEKYCKSGVTIGGESSSETKKEVEEKKYDKNKLYYLLFLNSGILLLLLTFIIKKRDING